MLDTLIQKLVGGLAKSLTYICCFFVMGQSMDAISDFMPVWDFQGALSGLPDTFVWGLSYVDAAGVLNLIIPAYATAFAFKRKSVFGG